jgi:hypothetical protein
MRSRKIRPKCSPSRFSGQSQRIALSVEKEAQKVFAPSEVKTKRPKKTIALRKQ